MSKRDSRDRPRKPVLGEDPFAPPSSPPPRAPEAPRASPAAGRGGAKSARAAAKPSSPPGGSAARGAPGKRAAGPPPPKQAKKRPSAETAPPPAIAGERSARASERAGATHDTPAAREPLPVSAKPPAAAPPAHPVPMPDPGADSPRAATAADDRSADTGARSASVEGPPAATEERGAAWEAPTAATEVPSPSTGPPTGPRAEPAGASPATAPAAPADLGRRVRPDAIAAPPRAAASSAPAERAGSVAVAPARREQAPVATAATSEYGPSIDRANGAPGTLRARLVEALRRLEEEARSRLGRPVGTEDRAHTPSMELLWRPLRRLQMRDRSDWVDEFGRDPRVYDRVAPLLAFFYRTWFRVESRGLDHIPGEGRALIVANHSGALPYDGAMMMYGVRRDHPAHREVRPLVEDFVFHFPYLGTLMNRIGAVRACQENAERLLRSDRLVAVFPEGLKGIGKLFSQRYRLQRFGRGGFIKLALATDSPIIPTAIVGAEEIHPMLARVTFLSKALGIPYLPVTPTFPWLGPIGLVPLPTRWYIAFGQPLYFNAEYGAEAASDRILVGKLAEQVRQKIQEMLDGMLGGRRSILFG